MKHYNVSGSTLIELVIVISLCALILTLSLSSVSFFDTALAHAQLDRLYTTCMFLQRKAIATNRVQRLIFDPINHTYSYNGHVIRLSKGVQFGVLSNIKGPPASPYSVLAQPITFKDNCIEFTPSGIIRPGSVYFVFAKMKVLYALTVSVAHYSHPRLYVYEGRWRLLGS